MNLFFDYGDKLTPYPSFYRGDFIFPLNLGNRTWTYDPVLPKHVLYQTELHRVILPTRYVWASDMYHYHHTKNQGSMPSLELSIGSARVRCIALAFYRVTQWRLSVFNHRPYTGGTDSNVYADERTWTPNLLLTRQLHNHCATSACYL